MNILKALIDDTDDVVYNERLFNTSAGIAALGPNPFVSSIQYIKHAAIICIVHNRKVTRSYAGHLELHARSIVTT